MDLPRPEAARLEHAARVVGAREGELPVRHRHLGREGPAVGVAAELDAVREVPELAAELLQERHERGLEPRRRQVEEEVVAPVHDLDREARVGHLHDHLVAQ
ncbi:MAG: hypothetical protein E6J57_09360 [Deltaproteobacteria bacterium]|nr:MAG: hypothetical protein E6J57_09360 [Deltaproteobacteria bacterium]